MRYVFTKGKKDTLILLGVIIFLTLDSTFPGVIIFLMLDSITVPEEMIFLTKLDSIQITQFPLQRSLYHYFISARITGRSTRLIGINFTR